MEVAIILISVLVLIIFVTIRFKVHPLFSLIFAAILSGLLFGFNTEKLIKAISEGFGKTLSSIGLIIAFGTTIGIFLEQNGGTKIIAERILNKISLKNAPLAMNIIGFIISIPVYCDSGFVILSSLNKALSKKTKIGIGVFAVALSTGLYAAHVFIPPTPGPLAAAAVLDADIGLVMLLGFLVAIPVSVVGYLWASFMGKKLVEIPTNEIKFDKSEVQSVSYLSTKNFIMVISPLLIPILLIALKSIGDYPTRPFGEDLIFHFLNFVGQPMIALLIGVIIVFLISSKASLEIKNNWISKSLKESGSIILVTGAGGAFGSVLRASNIADYMSNENMMVGGGLLLAFIVAAILKTAQGSSTVSIITTAALLSPLMAGFGLETEIEKVLSVLAIGAGALTVSHINDSYFWVVSQFSNLSVKDGLKGHSIGTLIQGFCGISIILILQLLLT